MTKLDIALIKQNPLYDLVNNLQTDRDHWKARADVFRDAIEKRKDCWACKFDDTCNNDFTNECLKNKKHCFQLDEARFMGGESK